MKPNKELSNILDESLGRLSGGETIEQCLMSHPEHISELEPLLKTALMTSHTTSAIKPGEEFRARARYQFKSAQGEIRARQGRSFFGPLPGWVAVLSIFLAVLLVGGGTVAAAGNSMADSPLYPVKLATEQVQLVLLASDLHRAEMEAEFVDKRVTEIIDMANKGNVRQVVALTKRLDNRLVMLAALAQAACSVKDMRQEAGAKAEAPASAVSVPPESKTAGETVPKEAAPTPVPAPPALGAAREDTKAFTMPDGQARLKRTIAAYAVKHPAVLRELLETAPEPVRPDISRAVAIAVAGYEKALKSLD